MSAAGIAGSVVAYGAKNLLINGSGRIKQRAYIPNSGTSTGTYIYDHWFHTNGTVFGWNSHVWTLNGEMIQHIELPDIANQIVTISLEDPSSDVEVRIGTYDSTVFNTGTITAGSGRRSVTLIVPPAATTHVQLKLVTYQSTTFKNIQLEKGPVATDFEFRHITIEEMLCQRYFTFGSAYHRFPSPASTFSDVYRVNFPVPMRATPTWSYNTTYSANLSAASVLLIDNTHCDMLDTSNANLNTSHAFSWSATSEL